MYQRRMRSTHERSSSALRRAPPMTLDSMRNWAEVHATSRTAGDEWIMDAKTLEGQGRGATGKKCGVGDAHGNWTLSAGEHG